MPMPAADIERLVRTAFPDATITLVDLAGDNDHYELSIISPVFQGKPRVAQHQMVYDALKGYMGSSLHALALKTAATA
jgi:stress-induced morphogen